MRQPSSLRPSAPRRGDAFGQMLLRCLESDEPVTEVVERDDGHIGTGDARRYFGDSGHWSPVTNWVIGQARGRILDVGAGAGQHSLHFQARGDDVTALDISPGAIDVVQQRGVQRTFHGSVHQLARRNPVRFDSAVFLGNNLGLFANPTELRRMASSLDRLVAPGGRVLGVDLDAYDTTEPDHLAYHARNRSRGRLGAQIRIRSRFHEIASPWFDYLMASVEEFEQLFEGTPWRIADVFRDRPNYALELRRR